MNRNVLHQTLQQTFKLVSFYTATIPELSFFLRHSPHRQRSAACRLAQTSIRRCFRLSTLFTGSGLHSVVRSPIFFTCIFWCMSSSFLAENKVINIADILLLYELFWSSAILFPWSIQFSLIRLKIIHYCCYIFFERNSLTLSWLRNFYLPVIFIKIRSYSLNPISWITVVSCRL